MSTVLGVILIFVYIAAVIGIAAAVTWIVVRLSPSPNKPKTDATAPPG